MPKIHATIVIAAPLDQVYGLAKDIEAFPEFMPDVEAVKIVETTPNGRQVSHWVGVVKEFRRTIKWTEEDYWDDENHVCTFRQAEGDFSLYRGLWQFKATEEGTQMDIDLEYEYDVPLIGGLIKGLLQRKMQENADNMLAALKAKAEGGR